MRKQLVICLCLAAALPACTPELSEYTQTEAPKQIHVDFTRVSHVVSFVPGKPELAPGEELRLHAFLGESQVSSQDHVYLEAGNDSQLTVLRIGALAREMDKRGIGARTLPAGLEPADRMKVIVERYVATPPDCPNWTSPAYGTHGNETHSNYGCADASNLARMVADPRDLVVGRPMGPPEGDAAIAGITRYRQGKPCPLPSTGGFAVSGGTSGNNCIGGIGVGVVNGPQ
jgi:pilus assembly protein CpaD